MLVFAACGSGDDTPDDAVTAPAEPTSAPTAAPAQTSPSSPTSTSAPGGSADAVAVPAALDFTAPLVGGGEIEMGEFAGRPVLLWFWAPW